PFAVSESAGLQTVGLPYEANPIVWQLELLLLSVGLPFFVVASTAPLVQRWFAATGDPGAADPYFLYAARNLASMGAPPSNPILLEPTLTLSVQSVSWAVGYVLLAILIASCGIGAWRKAALIAPPAVPDENTPPPDEKTPPVTLVRRLRWVTLAFVPSALMLPATTYIPPAVAAFPLLWVMPLAVYLLSFILVFARNSPLPLAWMHTALPVLTLVVVFAFLTNMALFSWQIVPFHWAVLFV